jgi:acetyl/propionyl-CoA carboxylase alpha subunit
MPVAAVASGGGGRGDRGVIHEAAMQEQLHANVRSACKMCQGLWA